MKTITTLFSVVIANARIRNTKTKTPMIINIDHLQKQVDLTKTIKNHYCNSIIYEL
ncbi:hypothetical protein [Flavobacterium gawalongense]|uniref:hypothetical protein n=1 Tax=Flavobacterium gawalongense TaxID=2594432 RepID=UPI00163DBC7F|nr:hypothetical protein [Flavobacterium gawalongense]